FPLTSWPSSCIQRHWRGQLRPKGHQPKPLAESPPPMLEPRRRHLTSFADIALRVLSLRIAAGLLALALPTGALVRASGPEPVELKPEARQAFALYAKLIDARNESELRGGYQLLWTDALPDKERAEAHAALLRGEVKIQKLQTQDGGQAIRCPG